MKCYVKDYPRPQFVRNNWQNLNGTWEFSFDDDNVGEKEHWYQDFVSAMSIQVPFTYETKMSGIGDETRHDNVWYHRTICVDSRMLQSNNYVLHFEGSDYTTKVWVNGQFAGCHSGGYARFSFDITSLVRDGENELVVKVEDSFNNYQPRGKQRWQDESFTCFYVQTTGIWKTVWSEYVPKKSLSYIKMTPDIQNGFLDLVIDVDAPESSFNGELMLETTITFQDDLINKTVTTLLSFHTCASVSLAKTNYPRVKYELKLWDLNRPHLYDVSFRLLEKQSVLDEIESYVAMREIRIVGSNILLNGLPLYQRLILDQGYWKDSHLTPPNEEALIEDIDKIKELGYNGLRKHQKTEDERFLYWCDVKGMLVWGEAPSAYRYSDFAVESFAKEWMEIVKQNYNHPCIITWTPFNESWGIGNVKNNRKQQHFTEAIYHLTKSIDSTRPVIVNDGWEHTVSDIITLHDYEEDGGKFRKRYENADEILRSDSYFNLRVSAFANGYEYKGQPIILSEYGGIAFNNDDSGWGYGNKVNTREEFVKRFEDITSAIQDMPYICGLCFTQVTDVQQEINGLMDIERNFKVEPKRIRDINERRV